MERGRYVLDAGALHRLLGLPPQVRVLFAYADPDPTAVHVVVEGEQLRSYGFGELQRMLGNENESVRATPVLVHPVNDPTSSVDWGTGVRA